MTQPQTTRASTLLWMIVLGMAVFMIANVPVYFVGVGAELVSLASGLIYLALVAALSIFLLTRPRWRGFGAGLLLGFAAMSITSSGTCTLFPRPPGGAYAELLAAFWYPIILVAGVVLAGIVSVVERSSNRNSNL